MENGIMSSRPHYGEIVMNQLISYMVMVVNTCLDNEMQPTNEQVAWINTA